MVKEEVEGKGDGCRGRKEAVQEEQGEVVKRVPGCALQASPVVLGWV